MFRMLPIYTMVFTHHKLSSSAFLTDFPYPNNFRNTKHWQCSVAHCVCGSGLSSQASCPHERVLLGWAETFWCWIARHDLSIHSFMPFISKTIV